MRWITVVPANTLADGARAFVDTDGRHIMVINLGGQYCAIESVCSHADFELDEAETEGDNIIWPLHGAHFCLRTGKALTPPAYENLTTFPVRIENNQVQVGIEE